MMLGLILQSAPATAVESTGIETSTYVFWLALLACIGLFFFFLKRTDNIINEKNKENEEPVASQPEAVQMDAADEEAAAIALAISMYQRKIHDMENLTITLQKVSKIYSPWSSKIYTLRQLPRK